MRLMPGTLSTREWRKLMSGGPTRNRPPKRDVVRPQKWSLPWQATPKPLIHQSDLLIHTPEEPYALGPSWKGSSPLERLLDDAGSYIQAEDAV
jgi:hypothetical protein